MRKRVTDDKRLSAKYEQGLAVRIRSGVRLYKFIGLALRPAFAGGLAQTLGVQVILYP